MFGTQNDFAVAADVDEHLQQKKLSRELRSVMQHKQGQLAMS